MSLPCLCYQQSLSLLFLCVLGDLLVTDVSRKWLLWDLYYLLLWEKDLINILLVFILCRLCRQLHSLLVLLLFPTIDVLFMTSSSFLPSFLPASISTTSFLCFFPLCVSNALSHFISPSHCLGKWEREREERDG